MNNVVASIKAHTKEWEISKIFENQNSCEIFKISSDQYPVLDDQLKKFMFITFSTTGLAITCVVFLSVEDITQYMISSYNIIVPGLK